MKERGLGCHPTPRQRSSLCFPRRRATTASPTFRPIIASAADKDAHEVGALLASGAN